MNHNGRGGMRRFFASRSNMVVVGFLAVGGFYLIAEHSAHLVGFGPLLLLLLLCIGMHFFMHAGHGSHGSDTGEDGRALRDGDGPNTRTAADQSRDRR